MAKCNSFITSKYACVRKNEKLINFVAYVFDIYIDGALVDKKIISLAHARTKPTLAAQNHQPTTTGTKMKRKIVLGYKIL